MISQSFITMMGTSNAANGGGGGSGLSWTHGVEFTSTAGVLTPTTSGPDTYGSEMLTVVQ